MTLETAVSRILDTLQSNEASNQEQASPQFYSGVTGIHDNTAGTTTPPLMLLISGQPESRSTRLMLSKSIKEVGNTYISFCADQPLPLFPRTGFIESLFDRADSVLFLVISISSRFVQGERQAPISWDGQPFREAAHSRAMTDVTKGNVTITTLQALCLIILFDFTGRYH